MCSEIGKKKKKEETASTQEEIRSEVWNEEHSLESSPLPPELRPKFQDIKAKAEAVASKQVMATTGSEYKGWWNTVNKEHEAFVKN